MKKIYLWCILILFLALGILSACGGGGLGDGKAAQPTTAVLTLSTAVTGTIPADTIIAGYEVIITFPSGVTVKASPVSAGSSTMLADAGVVEAAGTAAGTSYFPVNVYTAETTTVPGKLDIIILSNQANGFAPGEFSKITCNIAAGAYPAASDFPQPAFVASGLISDSTGSVISSVDLTAQLALTVTAVIN